MSPLRKNLLKKTNKFGVQEKIWAILLLQVTKKSADGICEYGVMSGAVPTKDIPKALTKCLSQF